METCVLIPQEFLLAMTADEKFVNFKKQVASLFTTTRIPQGKLFYPTQGTIRIGKLDVHSLIGEEDVRYDFLKSLYLLIYRTICFIKSYGKSQHIIINL